MSAYPKIKLGRREGSSLFRIGDEEAGFDLNDFWSWAFSDLVNNTTRGLLAEYLVGMALGVFDDGVRDAWAPYDLTAQDGTKVEVKSASYLQAWSQDRLSSIAFRIPKTRAFEAEVNQYSDDIKRQAGVYVFAVLTTKVQESLDPIDLSQWEFYVVPVSSLNQRTRSQTAITLPSVKQLAGDPISFDTL